MSRRDLLTVLTVGTAAAFIVAFGHIVTADGLSPMDVGLLVLHAVLTLWLVHGLWLAVVGFCVLAGRKLRDGFAAREAGEATCRHQVRRAQPRLRTALTIPVFNEEWVRVCQPAARAVREEMCR